MKLISDFLLGYDWRKLAARMRLDFFIPLLHKRKGYSPTELLLQKWQIEGNQRISASEACVILCAHCLISDGNSEPLQFCLPLYYVVQRQRAWREQDSRSDGCTEKGIADGFCISKPGQSFFNPNDLISNFLRRPNIFWSQGHDGTVGLNGSSTNCWQIPAKVRYILPS